MKVELSKNELITISLAIGDRLYIKQAAYNRAQGKQAASTLSVMAAGIAKLQELHKKIDALIDDKPLDLSAKRTSRAMSDLAKSSDVLDGDLSNGLDPIEEGEE